MPLYEVECLECGTEVEIILGLSEINSIKNYENMDLSEFGISCKNCQKTIFKKLISAHAKMSENWSAWNSRKK